MPREAIYLLAGVVLGGACLVAQGPLPGDVALTRSLQAVLGASPTWADVLTRTAKAPLVWLVLGLAGALAYARGGWRRAAAPPLALLGAHLVDALLRALVFAPRPTADLVAVASAGAGSGLPSTFALVYGALFGAVIFTPGRQRGTAALATGLGILLVAGGACARIVLAGHWPSQVVASLLVAFALAIAVHRLLQRAGAR